MRLLLSSSILVLALGNASCLRTTEFRCGNNAQCGGAGTCEAVGYCSFPDAECPSGVRFSDTAGTYANQCVGDTPPQVDAAVDGPVGVDAPVDGPVTSGCPAGYNTLTGGEGNHLYRLVTGSEDWTTQRSFCTATSTSAYLAIPDDLGELQAIATLAGAARFWVGITDSATENTWLTVKGAAATFLPWVAGAPDNNPPGEDCVEVVSATSQINDERCNTKYVAVCECEP